MKSSILLSVPKYVAISPNPLQKIPIATITSPALLALDELSKSQDGAVRGKKRRLDHLTWEEKIQRKKLKNRVAAQTSRDRKKAKMDIMEQTIDDLSEKAEILQNKCHTLEVINESLLAKNQKLDNEVQELGKQLKILQQQLEEQKLHTSNICSIYIPSAEGNGVEVNIVRSHETTTKQKNLQRQSSTCSSIEDNNALLALQDLLKDFDVNKFKDYDVEEFAEFLLTGVTEDLERNNSKSNNLNAESSSEAERLFGRVVGSTSECMESDRTANESNSQSIPINGSRSFCVRKKSVKEKLRQKQDCRKKGFKLEKLDKPIEFVDPSTIPPIDSSIQPETLYGTYNEKTHSITICLPDSNDPIEEIIEEVGCEEQEEETLKIPTMNCTSIENNTQSLMFSSSVSSIDEDLDYDPVKEFLSIPNVNERSNSPFSIKSDLGYGSMCSPDHVSKEYENVQFDELWDNTFTELFPTLL